MIRLLLPFALVAGPAFADDPVVTGVDAQKRGLVWRISVTLSHPDTGWDHYADGWRIETASGEVLGTRELAHPHVEEQPFTRSLSGVTFPDGTRRIFVRARCNVDGWAKETLALDVSP